MRSVPNYVMCYQNISKTIVFIYILQYIVEFEMFLDSIHCNSSVTLGQLLMSKIKYTIERGELQFFHL